MKKKKEKSYIDDALNRVQTDCDPVRPVNELSMYKIKYHFLLRTLGDFMYGIE